MNIINYPEEFVKRIKAEFPRAGELHDMLDRGDPEVGSKLYERFEGCDRIITPKNIAAARCYGTEKELGKTAETRERILGLYREWERIVGSQQAS